MAYLTDENIRTLEFDYLIAKSELTELRDLVALDLINKLKNEKSKNYCLYGLGRRILHLNECMKQFYDVFVYEYTNRNTEVPRDIRFNQTALLNYFFMNISGAMDNLAWIITLEKDIKLGYFDIVLDGKKVRPLLGSTAQQKLTDYNKWIEHIKSFRDPFAHRVPPYVMPSIHWDDGAISYESYYMHDFNESNAVQFHPQVIVDSKTISDLLKTIITESFP